MYTFYNPHWFWSCRIILKWVWVNWSVALNIYLQPLFFNRNWFFLKKYIYLSMTKKTWWFHSPAHSSQWSVSEVEKLTQTLCSPNAKVYRWKDVSFIDFNKVIWETKFTQNASSHKTFPFKWSWGLCFAETIYWFFSHLVSREIANNLLIWTRSYLLPTDAFFFWKDCPFSYGVTVSQHQKFAENDTTSTISFCLLNSVKSFSFFQDCF